MSCDRVRWFSVRKTIIQNKNRNKNMSNNNGNNTTIEGRLHGECMIFQSKVPANAKPKNLNGKDTIIIAESETVGNHHVLNVPEGALLYEDEKGTLFMETSVDATVSCVHENRHDTMTLPPGTYEFGTQQEYDPYEARMNAVKD
jgi:hypothetical protein